MNEIIALTNRFNEIEKLKSQSLKKTRLIVLGMDLQELIEHGSEQLKSACASLIILVQHELEVLK